MAEPRATERISFRHLDVALSRAERVRAASHVWERLRGPELVYVRGSLPTRMGIAVVGTRHPTAEALAFVPTLVAGLAEAGFSVWSGGAFGIDRAAHEAALALAAPTVLVAPTGLKNPYPAAHADLYERVVSRGGALVSLWPDETRPIRGHFLRRNRLLAALTGATVVVQAPLRSGARSAAASARALGRPVCVVPHPPWCSAGAGCILELLLGARPIRGAPDVVAAIGLGFGQAARWEPPRAIPPAAPDPSNGRAGGETQFEPALSELERALWAALGREPQHVDALCAASGRPAASVAQALLTLTLRSVVVEGPAGHYRRGRS